MTADEMVEILELEPLEGEGGMFRRTFADGHSSAIYFLLREGEATQPHRLPGTEVFHHYLGDPVQMLLLGPAGGPELPVLGTDLASGERPQVVVPGGFWQAAKAVRGWALMGTTMAPRFEWEDLELASAEELLAPWPDHAAFAGPLLG